MGEPTSPVLTLPGSPHPPFLCDFLSSWLHHLQKDPSELELTTCSHLQIPVQSSQMQLVKTPRETASSFQTRVLSNLHATVLAAVLICCSVTQSCPALGDPMDCSTPGFPVLHHFPELASTHVHQVGDAIQPSRHLSSPSTLVFNLSKHQGLSNESILHIRWPKYWELQLQHQAFQ